MRLVWWWSLRLPCRTIQYNRSVAGSAARMKLVVMGIRYARQALIHDAFADSGWGGLPDIIDIPVKDFQKLPEVYQMRFNDHAELPRLRLDEIRR
jgi:hypothetical protein